MYDQDFRDELNSISYTALERVNANRHSQEPWRVRVIDEVWKCRKDEPATELNESVGDEDVGWTIKRRSVNELERINQAQKDRILELTSENMELRKQPGNDFDTWINDCRERQIRIYDLDPADPAKWTREQLADYRRTMTLAAIVELTELMDTLRWKPWTHKDPKPVGDKGIADEAADVMLFVGNLVSMYLGVNAASELRQAITRKSVVVEKRFESNDYAG